MRRALLISAVALSQSACGADLFVTLPEEALPKSFFTEEGAFWSRPLVLEVAPEAAPDGLVIGRGEPATRVAFEITEEFLLARALHARPHAEGDIVGSFRIAAHVDAFEADRPWHEREYIVVDWSENHATDRYRLDLASLAQSDRAASYASIAHYSADPADPHAPTFVLDEGYFDVTVRALVAWHAIDIAGTKVPGCMAASDAFLMPTSCQNHEIVVRHAFLRVDEGDTEILPASAPSAAFGTHLVEVGDKSFGYDRSDYQLLQSRHAVWKATHASTQPCLTSETGADPNRDDDGDGTDDECAAVGGGSRCDPLQRQCTTPYRERTTRALVWYLLDDSDDDLFATTAEAVLAWDVALRSAVSTARYAECRRTGGEDCHVQHPVLRDLQRDFDDALSLAQEFASCQAAAHTDCSSRAAAIASERGYATEAVALATAPPMAHLCHSPVRAEDDAACAPPGTSARFGDLRYNVIRVRDEMGPWLVAAGAVDPLTGARIADSITISHRQTMMDAAGATELVRVVHGEIEPALVPPDFDGWAQAVARVFPHDAPLPSSEVVRRTADFVGVTPAEYAAIADGVAGDDPLRDALNHARDDVAAVFAAPPPHDAEALSALRESSLDAELMTPALQEVSSSPFGINHPAALRIRRNARRLTLEHHGECVYEHAPPPFELVGAAPMLEEKFGPFDPTASTSVQLERAQRMNIYLGRRLHRWIALHAMGHAMGLTHHLAGSADAWFYPHQYWQLRTRDGMVERTCDDLEENGESCVGPRYFDPLTPEERSGLLSMFMQSSVMDEPGDATQTLRGLGAYDVAAVHGLYADASAVYDDPSFGAERPRGIGALARLRSGVLGFVTMLGDESIDPSQLQGAYDMLGTCERVDPQRHRPSAYEDDLDGVWHPLLDGGLVRVAEQHQRCRQPRIDHVSWSKLLPFTNAQGTVLPVAVDDAGRARLPFTHARESMADVGNPHVMRGDWGADAYEAAGFLVAQEELGAVFRARRDPPWVHGVLASSFERAERLRALATGPALLVHAVREVAEARQVSFDDAWALVGPSVTSQVLAAGEAFDELARLAVRPAPGAHKQLESSGILVPTDNALVPIAAWVPRGVHAHDDAIGFGGRELGPDVFPLTAGAYFDKAYAALFFSEASAWFEPSDPPTVSLARTFSQSYRRLLAELLAGDPELLGARVVADSAGKPVTGANALPTQPLGWIRWWRNDGPEVCWPTSSAPACSAYAQVNSGRLDGAGPSHTAIVDPQLDIELRKFVAVWSIAFLPAAPHDEWQDTLQLWQGRAPIVERMELHAPDGRVFVARADGKEIRFGRAVHRGVAARVLQRADELLARAYATTGGPDLDGDSEPDWRVPVFDPQTGEPILLDDAVDCRPAPDVECPCAGSAACASFVRYLELIATMQVAAEVAGFD